MQVGTASSGEIEVQFFAEHFVSFILKNDLLPCAEILLTWEKFRFFKVAVAWGSYHFCLSDVLSLYLLLIKIFAITLFATQSSALRAIGLRFFPAPSHQFSSASIPSEIFFHLSLLSDPARRLSQQI